MARSTRKFVALSVAVLYSALALASHSLHDWIGCEHEHGTSVASCEAAHSCVGCHHTAGDHAAPGHDARQGFRTAGQGHDASTCSVCVLVAKLKTGHAAALVQVSIVQSVVASLPTSDSFAPTLLQRPLSARGPPALVA